MAELDAALSEAIDNSPAPEAPSAPAVEPARIDVIREAVTAQKEGRAPDMAKAAPTDGRARAPDGKFVPSTDKPAPDRTASPARAAVAVQGSPAAPVPADPNAPPAAEAAPVVRPPPGWSPASKVAFDTLPESVKSDIVKREAEVNKGFEKLASYKGVDKYVDMAAKGGTTLDKALEQYTGIETLLKRDVFAGVEQILKNVGVNPVSFFQAWQQRQSGQPAQPAQAAPAHQPAFDPSQIAAQVRREIQAEQEQASVVSELQRFENDPKNRFYANVKPIMARLIQNGLAEGATPAEQLKDAYDKACRMDPATYAVISAPPAADPRIAAATQARAAARATIGAPSSGLIPGVKAPPANQTRLDFIRATVAAQKGGRA